MLLVASLAPTVAVVVSCSSTWGGKAPVARQGFRCISPGFGGGKERVKVPSIRYWLRCRHPPCSACGNKVWWAYINRLETRDGWMVNFQMWGLGHYIIGGSKLGQGSVHSLLIRSTYPFVFPPTRHDTSAADAAVASAGRKGATHLRVSLHQKPRGFSEYLYVPSRYPVYPLPTHWWPTSGI